MKINRRNFTLAAASAGAYSLGKPLIGEPGLIRDHSGSAGRLKISLNSFSFNKLLLDGSMTLDDLIEFCALKGFDGLDPTGYYFKGYPAPPSDDLIFHIKQKAFSFGIDLGCTGVRNDFTWADPARREQEKKLVKDWVIVASKLGAPGLRIFCGTLSKEDYSWDDRAKWIASDIAECADFAAKYGVMIALQNHNDFLKTPDEIDAILKMVNHKWVGLMLDIGSFRSLDPYKDIEKIACHAITWQMKEKVFINDTQVDTDYSRIIEIVRKAGYSGYLPIETLGEGDPYSKVEALLAKVRRTISL